METSEPVLDETPPPRTSRAKWVVIALLGVAVFATAITATVAPPDATSARNDLAKFIGRLHPVMVHLPIGLIVLVPILEICGLPRRFRHLQTSAGFVLWLATLNALLAIALGYTLAQSERQFDLAGNDTLQGHLIAGIVTAALCVITLALRVRATPPAPARRRPLATAGYAVSLTLLLCMMSIAGHLGGQLTYGEAYLSSVAPRPIARFLGPVHDGPSAPPATLPTTVPSTAPASPATAPIAAAALSFETTIQPIMMLHCVSCHGPSKVKGDLRVDSLEHLYTGGAEGPSVIGGRPEQSPLYARMVLPIDDDEVMPPDSAKLRPTAEEIALVRQWILDGAK